MEGAKRRRRREWRAAGRGKAERTVRLIALILTALVIAVTLILGHLRKHEAPPESVNNLTASAGSSDDPQ